MKKPDIYYADYTKARIGGQNPYYKCTHCGISDPQINGKLENHLDTCEYRIAKERGWNYPSIDLYPYEGVRFFVDLDGTLADFDSYFNKVFGPVKSKDDFEWQDLHKVAPDIYAELDPMPGALKLWDFIDTSSRFHTTERYILTAIPRRWSWPNVTKHKRAWCRQHLGTDTEVLFGPYAEDKQYHCKNTRDILIDDMPRNIAQWKAQGGIGILFTNADDTIEQLKQYGL